MAIKIAVVGCVGYPEHELLRLAKNIASGPQENINVVLVGDPYHDPMPSFAEQLVKLFPEAETKKAVTSFKDALVNLKEQRRKELHDCRPPCPKKISPKGRR